MKDAMKNQNGEGMDAIADIPCDDLFADLLEQWERRAQTAQKLANDAAGAGDWTTNLRCKTKAGVIRSMVSELKREISQANRQISEPDKV